MSSDQFSEKPMPAERHCPHCDAVIAANASACWLCLEKVSIQEGQPPCRARGSGAPSKYGVAKGDHMAWIIIGALAIVLGIGLAFVAPAVLIVLLAFATPALIRTLAISNRERAPDLPSSGVTFVGIFLSSLGVTTIVGVAAFIAFFGTCLAVCAGIVGFGNVDIVHGKSGGVYSQILLPCSVGVGLVPGSIVAYWLFRLLWRRKG